VCLPIAPHILLSAQVYLAIVTHAQQQIASPCLVSSKLPKKFKKIKKKYIKVFARFSENVLYFCRPHPTLVVGANFCGCIFFDPCLEKNKKNGEKIKKFDSYLCLLEKFREKFSKKENSGFFACSVVLSIVLCFHLVALRLDVS
jgi:hypothetical protein